jgi:hypothetical protein
MAGEEGDREALWTFLMTVGVDGLCTNYPREFKNWQIEVSHDTTVFNKPWQELAR